MKSVSNNFKKLKYKEILAHDGITKVKVYDGKVNYGSGGKFLNYAYLVDKDGNRAKTKPYMQYTAMTNRALDGGCHQKNFTTYEGVKLDSRFSNYDDWVAWAERQSGYMWVDEKGKLFEQDKDLLGDGKLYSPETCCFLPREINCYLKFAIQPEPIGIEQTTENSWCVYRSDHTQFTVYDKGVAESYATHRVKSNLFDVVNKYFDCLDDNVVEALIDIFNDKSVKTYTKGRQHLKVSKENDAFSKFKETVAAFILGASKKAKSSNLPEGVVHAPKKQDGLFNGYYVQCTYRGTRIVEDRKKRMTLKEAELESIRVKLKGYKMLKEDFGGYERCVNSEHWKVVLDSEKLLKEKFEMLVSGMF